MTHQTHSNVLLLLETGTPDTGCGGGRDFELISGESVPAHVSAANGIARRNAVGRSPLSLGARGLPLRL